MPSIVEKQTLSRWTASEAPMPFFQRLCPGPFFLSHYEYAVVAKTTCSPNLKRLL